MFYSTSSFSCFVFVYFLFYWYCCQESGLELIWNCASQLFFFFLFCCYFPLQLDEGRKNSEIFAANIRQRPYNPPTSTPRSCISEIASHISSSINPWELFGLKSQAASLSRLFHSSNSSAAGVFHRQISAGASMPRLADWIISQKRYLDTAILPVTSFLFFSLFFEA